MLLLCPICAEEFEVNLSRCPNCGVNLIRGSIDNASSVTTRVEKIAPVEFRELCRPRGYPFAMLIKQTLEQNGIAVIVQGGHSMSVLPSLPFLGELRVLVAAEQFDYASEVYRAYFGGEHESSEVDESDDAAK
jgi:hypothetical protein